MAHSRNKFYAKFEFNGKGQHKKVLINDVNVPRCKNDNISLLACASFDSFTSVVTSSRLVRM